MFIAERPFRDAAEWCWMSLGSMGMLDLITEVCRATGWTPEQVFSAAIDDRMEATGAHRAWSRGKGRRLPDDVTDFCAVTLATARSAADRERRTLH